MLELFLQKYKTKNGDEAISCVKKMDFSFLPPCVQDLKQNIKRRNLVAGKWISSVLTNPPEIPPIRSGLILDKGGLYKINWFEGNMSPRSLDAYTEEENDAKMKEKTNLIKSNFNVSYNKY